MVWIELPSASLRYVDAVRTLVAEGCLKIHVVSFESAAAARRRTAHVRKEAKYCQ